MQKLVTKFNSIEIFVFHFMLGAEVYFIQKMKHLRQFPCELLENINFNKSASFVS